MKTVVLTLNALLLILQILNTVDGSESAPPKFYEASNHGCR